MDISKVQHVMVTDWKSHWDNLGSSSYYTESMMRDGLAKSILPPEATTLFIRKNKDSFQVEKSWVGKAKNFRKEIKNGSPAVRFDVTDLREVKCPPEFQTLSNGWYLNKTQISIPFSNVSRNLQPQFFSEMNSCDALTFELHCFHLLRLLGIHDLHKFPQNNNSGKADGFFRFNSLTVIYDATLMSDFHKRKDVQIENYIAQLQKDKVEVEVAGRNVLITIKESNKQVWIITRGLAIRHIKTEDNIDVKEIPFSKLIETYDKRLLEEIGATALCKLLENLA